MDNEGCHVERSETSKEILRCAQNDKRQRLTTDDLRLLTDDL